jgi:CDP-paratose 2-epimerase
VTVFDSLQRPGSERNLQWLLGLAPADQLRVVRGDVRDADLVRLVVSASDVQLVFHFAAQTAVTTSLVRPREDLEVNLLGTFNVLEAVRASRAPTPPILFYTSTNKVYGALAHRRTRETARRYRFVDEALHAHGVGESEPLDFHSPYGCSKGAADQYVRDYARIYGLRTVVFRMSCIYGPRQFGNEDQGWVAHFMFAAAGGRPLTIYGDGKQVRDLLYIDDLVRAFRLAARHVDQAAGKAYNIGGGPNNTVSIWRELRPYLESVAHARLDAHLRPWRPGDQAIYVSDTRAARRDFGWQPRVSVEEGLRRLWAWTQVLRSTAAEKTNGAVTSPLALVVPPPSTGAANVSPSA